MQMLLTLDGIDAGAETQGAGSRGGVTGVRGDGDGDGDV